MTDDQIYIPEDKRPFPSVRNPAAHSYMWRPQEDLLEEDEMRDPNWYPKETYYNIYNRPDHQRSEGQKFKREHSLSWANTTRCCSQSDCDNALFKQLS